ncbi:hypothetical protein KA057_03965 [Candidatus Gracilibacteria bacterium]|nr:hypothetical protein [Candidatus Gracilibacteria bacterium]
MINNIELFELSINNPEPYIDKYYVKNSRTIISDDKTKLNKLMLAREEILDNIAAYKIAVKGKNKAMRTTTLKNIISALEVAGINFSEFTSYWAIKDISYSVYKNTLRSEKLKIEFLTNIIPEFIKDRHDLYRHHGYSFSTLQAISDSKAHKSNGATGNIKIIDIFNSFGFTALTSNNISDFIDSDRVYICPDKNNKALFKEILAQYKIKFDWSHNHENKQTDFLFKVGSEIFIMEHKHMKEAGGGQDKQMSEIINFISYKDTGVHYVSFLDGVYFNLLADKSVKNGKPFYQRKSIVDNLGKNKQNYFVNTCGFTELMKNLTA